MRSAVCVTNLERDVVKPFTRVGVQQAEQQMHQEKLATAAASAVPAHELQEVSRGSAPALEAPCNNAGSGAPAASGQPILR